MSQKHIEMEFKFKLPESKTSNLLLVVFEMLVILLTFGINLGLTAYDFQLTPLFITLIAMSIWNRHKLTKENFYPIKPGDDGQNFYLTTLMIISFLLLIVLSVPLFPGQLQTHTQQFISTVIIAPIAEEIIFRHYMIGRLSDVYGKEPKGVILSIVISSIVFSLGHSYQGMFGVLAALLKGFIFAGLYLMFRRNLVVPTFVHGLHNFIVTVI